MKNFLKRMLNPYVDTSVMRAIRRVPSATLNNEAANKEISELLNGEVPVLVTRVGETEGSVVASYIQQKNSGIAPSFSNEIKRKMTIMPGFFPADDKSLVAFSELYLDSIAESDIYASWTPHERLFESWLPVKRCKLTDLEPFWSSSPWTDALSGKKVLVITQFTSEVESQYNCHRAKLFENFALPEFELKTFKPPMTMNYSGAEFSNWFEALDKTTASIRKIDFDIALVSAGSYGLPISFKIKSFGRKAIVLGGVLQIFFGVFGNRWLQQKKYKSLLNDNWIFPGENTRPPDYEKMEGGAYW